jgi:hypothetical protein
MSTIMRKGTLVARRIRLRRIRVTLLLSKRVRFLFFILVEEFEKGKKK